LSTASLTTEDDGQPPATAEETAVAADKGDSPSVRQIVAFFAMVVGMFVAVLNVQIVGSSFKEIQAGLAAGRDEVSWVLTSALIAEVVMIPLSGWLSRFLSTRWLFTIAAGGFSVFSLACAFSWNIESMVVFRSIQGFFGGAMMPTVFASTFLLFPPRMQNAAVAGASVVGTSAVAIGPTLGGWISEALSWHWLFLVSVPVGTFVMITVAILVDFDRPNWRLGRRIDFLGIVLAAIFFGSVLIILEEGRREDWFASHMIVTLTIVAFLAGLFLLWRELEVREPVIDFRAFKNRNFVVGCFYIGVFGSGLYVPLYLLPLFLARVRDMSTEQIGTTVVVLGLAMIVSAPSVGYMLRYIPRRYVAAMGFSMLAIGNYLQAGLTAESGFYDLLLPQIIRGLSTQMCFLPMISLALGKLPPEQVKNASGLFNLTMRLGAAVAIAVANNFLEVRTQHNYARIIESLPVGTQAGQQVMSKFHHMFELRIGDSPQASEAALHLLIRLAEREAMVLAFNDVTIAAAIWVACSLVLLPLVRSVR